MHHLIKFALLLFSVTGCAVSSNYDEECWEKIAGNLSLPKSEILLLKETAEINHQMVVRHIYRDDSGDIIVMLSMKENSPGGLSFIYFKKDGEWIPHPDYYGAPWDIH